MGLTVFAGFGIGDTDEQGGSDATLQAIKYHNLDYEVACFLDDDATKNDKNLNKARKTVYLYSSSNQGTIPSSNM